MPARFKINHTVLAPRGVAEPSEFALDPPVSPGSSSEASRSTSRRSSGLSSSVVCGGVGAGCSVTSPSPGATATPSQG